MKFNADNLSFKENVVYDRVILNTLQDFTVPGYTTDTMANSKMVIIKNRKRVVEPVKPYDYFDL